jgi:hypothetical protein
MLHKKSKALNQFFPNPDKCCQSFLLEKPENLVVQEFFSSDTIFLDEANIVVCYK